MGFQSGIFFQQETPVDSQQTIQKIKLADTLAAEDMPKMLFKVEIESENNPKQIRTLIGLKPCFYNSIKTQN